MTPSDPEADKPAAQEIETSLTDENHKETRVEVSDQDVRALLQALWQRVADPTWDLCHRTSAFDAGQT